MATRILILGGGYAGVRVAQELARRLEMDRKARRDEVTVTLVDRRPCHILLTRMHQVAAGTLEPEAAIIPLDRLFLGRPVSVLQATVQGIDLDGRTVATSLGRPLPYDVLVVALGSAPEYFGIPGLAQHSLSIYSLEDSIRFAREWQRLARSTGPSGSPRPTVVIGGGGVSGVELAGELADRLDAMAARSPRVSSPPAVRVLLVEGSPGLLPGMPTWFCRSTAAHLARQGVEVLVGTPIARVEEDGTIRLNPGQAAAWLCPGGRRAEGIPRELKADLLMWTGGVRAHPLVTGSLTTDGRGRAKANPFLQSVDRPDLFVCGDCALASGPGMMPAGPTAQNAVRQASLVAHNVWALVRGGSMIPYDGRTKGVLFSVGAGFALGRLFNRYDVSGLPAHLLKRASEWNYLAGLVGLPAAGLPWVLGWRRARGPRPEYAR